MVGLAPRTLADTAATDFENFTLGSVNGQDSWSATSPSYDEAIVSTSDFGSPAGFGLQSLRVSDSVTSGSFGDWVFAAPLSSSVGEATATPAGTHQNHFEMQFDIAAASPTAQPGSHVSVAPDRGDGSRMSYLRFEDQLDGIHVFFDDVSDAGPIGTTATFNETDIATLDRTIPHTIRLTLDAVDGPSNDVVRVYIDGVLVHAGTSWEDYYRYDSEASAEQSPRAVDTMIIQARGTAQPGDLGFLFDNLSLSSSTIAPSDTVPGTSDNQWTTSSGVSVSLAGTNQTGQTVTANIPLSTTVTASGTGVWDGIINPPTVTSVSLPPVSGFTTTVTSAIEIGSDSFSLSFDKSVRLLFPSAANQLVGFIPVGGAFTPITTVCNGDTQGDADSQLLPAGGACYMNVGPDLVVWTTHFTQFVTYTKTVVTPAVQTTKSNTYVVQSGDTMSSIAQKFGLTLAQLESLNPQAGHPAGNFDLILTGDILNVSNAVLLTSSAAPGSNAAASSSTGTTSVLGSNTGNGQALSTNATKTTPAVASAVTASSSGKLLGLKWWWWVVILVVVAAILYYVYRLADANKHDS